MSTPVPDSPQTCTAFIGPLRLASGALAEVAVAVHRALEADPQTSILVFDDQTARLVDLDTRGDEAAVRARYAPESEPPRGRGRPKLGVVAREVTLLPRHWDWLSRQPGGASVALRKLVDGARSDGRSQVREAQEAAYRFMSAMGGDLPGFEEASRALFAGDRGGLEDRMAPWPADLREHVLRLAQGAWS
ncbi:DUF2239 family protein [Caulobacter sp. NIBR2454]|uniref:DUF2239 family protein n=1 Tax=Caulobacter sp. NIBR2454 TaxID=3015996 RepID=UPI0022B6D3E7|nr:DUF2239 family protein [Caulobacter sp. NIBR2454]